MPTKKARVAIQFDTEELKQACQKFVVDKNIKSLSNLINQVLTELMIKEGYYQPPQPPKLLK